MRTKFQTNRILRCATLFAVAIAAFGSGTSQAQQSDGEITLDIGSKAPTLDIETWISDREGAFKPVTKFEDGKIYVVEFWATWCGPCISSMPHLVETQEKHYDDGVQIISVTREDMDTVDKFLKRNVRGEDELTYRELTSAYCLTSDPDSSTSRDYMKAAGQGGIPCAFVVGKTGLIEWIGHPMSMDKPLQQVVADTWDRDAFKAEIKEEREQQAKTKLVMQQLQKSMAEVDKKMSAGDDEGALAIMGELIENDEYKVMRQRLIMMRAQVALTMKAPAAVAAFEAGVTQAGESPEALNQLAWAAVEAAQEGEEIQPGLLTAAMKAAQKALAAGPENASVLDTVAHLFQLQGDLDKAIETQKMALENAGDLTEQIEPYLNELKAMKAAE